MTQIQFENVIFAMVTEMEIYGKWSEIMNIDESKCCFYCIHYKSNGLENECMKTRDYCFRVVYNCELFEQISIVNTENGGF